MIGRQVGRAGSVAVTAALLFSGTALADTVAADGDVITSGIQGFVDLGTVAPAASLSLDVGLTLFCSGLQHVDPGQFVTVSQTGATVPAAGGSITASSASFGTVPADWANDTEGIAGCSGPMHLDSLTPSHVVLVAPPTAGLDYAFVVDYGRTLSPPGVADASSISGFTSVAFVLDVEDATVDTTPPTFASLPADLDVTTDDPAGAIVDFVDPIATDDLDPAPTVSCDPPAGSVFLLGTTTVTCTATDASGNQATETFTVTVHQSVVAWEEPVHAAGVIATRGRSLPVKARAWLDGAPIAGDAELILSSCESLTAPPVMTVGAPRQADAGRWMTILDTSGLDTGCYAVELVVDGHPMGSFLLTIVAPPDGVGPALRGENHPA